MTGADEALRRRWFGTRVRRLVLALIPVAVVLSAVPTASAADQLRPVRSGSASLPAGVPDPARDPIRVSLSKVRPAVSRASSDSPVVYRDGCHVRSISASRAHLCVFGDTSAKRTVVLVGDSHAAQWFPAFERATRALHVRLVYATKSACPGPVVSVRIGSHGRACDAWRRNVYALLKRLPRIDVLVVTGSAHAALVDRRTHVAIRGSAAVAHEWAAGVRRTVAALGPSADRIVVLRDTPELATDSGRCLLATGGDNRACGTAYSRAVPNPVWRAERDVARGLATVGTADFSAAFCTSTRCRPVTRTGILRWRNRGHMSATFAPLLAPLVRRMLAAALSGRLTD